MASISVGFPPKGEHFFRLSPIVSGGGGDGNGALREPERDGPRAPAPLLLRRPHLVAPLPEPRSCAPAPMQLLSSRQWCGRRTFTSAVFLGASWSKSVTIVAKMQPWQSGDHQRQAGLVRGGRHKIYRSTNTSVFLFFSHNTTSGKVTMEATGALYRSLSLGTNPRRSFTYSPACDPLTPRPRPRCAPIRTPTAGLQRITTNYSATNANNHRLELDQRGELQHEH